jgi:L-asparaginase/beta-aspartyl-peptidase (threonine type)
MTYAILTHGGAASPSKHSDGCVDAAGKARDVLESGGTAFDAALVATTALEDDIRFNAGTGSNLRLDGALIEMDAAVMSSDGRFGGVACIQRVKNPVLVAARVRETPHLLLVGDGATAFARRHGVPDFDPATPGARAKYARALAELQGKGDGHYRDDAAPWAGGKARSNWNFPGEPIDCDTVGAVVRDASGAFAATASTGGTLYMLRGRVGDSPLMGCGVYAGPHGAVAATGVGEEIVRRFLSKTVYDWLASGLTPEAAADRAVAMFPTEIDVGLLVVGRTGHAIRANRDMASAALTA